MSPRVAVGAVLAGSGWIALSIMVAGVVALVRYGYSPLDAEPLSWWYLWRDYPAARLELLEAAGIGAGLVALPFVALGLYAVMQPRPLHGAARFATDSEIRGAGLLRGEGIVIGKHRGRYLTLPGQVFVALMAPTRSGKGVGVVVPNLLTWPDSAVVLDIKGENHQITSAYRAAHGQAVYRFDPFSDRTHRYNPLAFVSDDPRKRTAELLSIGYAIYPRVGRDPIWNDTARDLFVGLCLYLYETPDAPVTIGEVLRLSAGDGRPLKEFITELVNDRLGSALPISMDCAKALRRFASAPDNTAGGILTTFSAPLTLWQSPIVDAATSASDFDLRELRRQRMTVYVAIPPNRLPEADILLRLLFTQLVNCNTDARPEDDPSLRYQCLALLDEAAAPGHMPILDKAVPYIAGYGLRLVTIFQSRGQVAKPVDDGGYGREGARTLIDNHACRVMFTPKSVEDANELSELLGTETVKARSRRVYKFGEATESDHRRPLMLPQELMQMPATDAIVHLEGVRPIRCNRIRYYAERTFTRRLASVAPSLRGRRWVTATQLSAAITAGELASPVPMIEVDIAHREYGSVSTRPATVEDIEGGINLDRLDIDIENLPTYDEPMSDADVGLFVASFCEAVGIEPVEAVSTPANAIEPAPDATPSPAELVDLSPLRA